MSSSSSSSVAISSTTRLLKRNTTIIVTGVGLGIVFIGYLIKRYWSKHDDSEQDDADEQLLTRPYDAALG
ncbi:unnamed protein product [Anisakis simplex]|uniref:Syndecan n=1 Tax=Anisakis simplex TaxID=6269 RepID=A0A0M3J8L9_ANISI|nr:unnamed protein product [Anisakis simplex]